MDVRSLRKMREAAAAPSCVLLFDGLRVRFAATTSSPAADPASPPPPPPPQPQSQQRQPQLPQPQPSQRLPQPQTTTTPPKRTLALFSPSFGTGIDSIMEPESQATQTAQRSENPSNEANGVGSSVALRAGTTEAISLAALGSWGVGDGGPICTGEASPPPLSAVEKVRVLSVEVGGKES